jgi:hypothetical protein
VAEHAGTTVASENGEVIFENALSLRGVKAIDAETAAALAAYDKGPLFLDGMTTLDAAGATALARPERDLHLSLTALDAEAAATLAEFRGQELSVMGTFTESVGGPTPLTPEVARLIQTCAEYHESGADLPSVTALDTPAAVEIAGILASIKGPLSLPSLRKISPKALMALVEKEDVAIPLLETLELIAEPDGSLTEDFVVPEGFEERQQRQLQ